MDHESQKCPFNLLVQDYTGAGCTGTGCSRCMRIRSQAILAPHEVADAVYDYSPRLFENTFTGGDDNLLEVWEYAERYVGELCKEPDPRFSLGRDRIIRHDMCDSCHLRYPRIICHRCNRYVCYQCTLVRGAGCVACALRHNEQGLLALADGVFPDRDKRPVPSLEPAVLESQNMLVARAGRTANHEVDDDASAHAISLTYTII